MLLVPIHNFGGPLAVVQLPELLDAPDGLVNTFLDTWRLP
jgi:hypothetical protein